MLFAGPGEADSTLPLELRAAGCTVTAIDTKLGGPAHDVLRGQVGLPLLQRVRGAEFDAVFIATPCSSYSVRHDPALRSDTEPLGVDPLPAGWGAYVAKHNLLADYTAQVWRACVDSSTPVALENPASRSDKQSPAHWSRFPRHGSLWHMPCIASALGASRACFHTFSQCMFQANAQKWTTIASGGDLSRTLAGLGAARYHCSHGSQRHEEVLTGRDALGRSRAGEAAAYPASLNRLLARAVAESALATRRRRSARPLPAQPTRLPTIFEGLVAEGPALGPTAHAACEAARRLPPRFAHADLSIPTPPAHLRAESFPGDLAAPVNSTRPSTVCKALRRRRLPLASEACARIGCCTHPFNQPAPTRPAGPIAIESLFLPGVYVDEVLTWFALADTATAAVRAGAAPPAVPTRVIGQHSLQPWARGVVWDCCTHGHLDCRPVRRSTRFTSFPGKRQVDREAIRRVAALLAWHDEDIVDQVGEGGVEVRSDCTFDIVLAYHHPSLTSEIGLAESTVAAHIAEEWVAPPTRHLPYVPCRLQPRGVVMQPRARLLPDGVTLEEYDKPRITTDSSFGGPDSVNAGVSDVDRTVALPSIQTLARGWAICQAAYDQPASQPAPQPHPPVQPRVQGYCIDAESAYSFCPIQHADLWTQCFVWWDAAGHTGVAQDRRMGFGGAFAPNRFERFSTLVAAYAQHLHAALDSEQPPPACAQLFTSERRALQRTGRLPPGEAQLHPRFLQVFMDDFTGAAGDDPVIPPPSVAHITIQPEHMVAAGCTPASPTSRVHVHARLTMLALSLVGLHAAPHKVAVGQPLPALGLLVDGAARRVRCPPTKLRTVLADISAQHASAVDDGSVDRGKARRLVGRLNNLSQVAPLIRPLLHGGYTVCEARWPGPGGRVGTGHMRLRSGSSAHADWLALLSHAATELAADTGVALAPRQLVPPRDAPHTLTAVTDASGDDGFGGYAFHSSVPHTAFVMCEEWPSSAVTALRAASSEAEAELRRRSDASALPHLSMPAAELFAQALLPLLVARVAQSDVVYALGDCGPAVGVVDALYSRNPQMRATVLLTSAQPCTWVGVKVPREANRDADRLSHPALLDAVLADIPSSWTVQRVRPTKADWDALDAIILTTAPGTDGRPPRKRRRDRPE